MIERLYETYGIFPFIIAFLIIVILILRHLNKDANKRADEFQAHYAESETKRRQDREKKEKADKEVEKYIKTIREEYAAQITKERSQNYEKVERLIRVHNQHNIDQKKKNEASLSEMSEHYESEISNLQRHIEILQEQSQYDTETINKQDLKIASLSRTITELKHQIQEKEYIIDEQYKDIGNLKAEHKNELLLIRKKMQANERTVSEIKERFDKRNSEFEKIMSNNLEAMPYLAGLMSDYLTYDMEVLANQLDWGSNVQRKATEVKLRELRKETKAKLEEAKYAEYQLAYLLQLYPEIEEIIDTDYRKINDKPSVEKLLSSANNSETDCVRQYLTTQEWKSLSDSERNQIALDRYIEGRRKSNWQIGRDYELYVGYSLYERNGWDVRYYGSEKRLEDLGRDLIAKKGLVIEIVQCKYWGKEKTIHEKHIFQLYGTKICYEMEHDKDTYAVKAKFITNIKLSPKAKEVADILGIEVIEDYPISDFPRIKCNIGKEGAKIYHLPMDQQYDNVIIDKSKGEMLVTTVKEAERNGFRRAYKWHL